MSVRTPRLSRVAIFAAAGAAALAVAACGSTSAPPSSTTSPSTASTTVASPTTKPTTTSPGGEARVSGLIASVANNSAQVTQKSGTATVNFTDSTKVTETTNAALTDVTQGSCVSVRPVHKSHGSDPVTAASVRVSPAVDGKCPQGKESAPGSTTTSPPSPSPTPSGKKAPIVGAVASVVGNTINVTSTDASGNPSQTAVTVNDKTTYTKQATANAQAITQGKCLTAKGTKDPNDGSGALQATTIDLRAANNGKCKGHDHDQ
jgi:hypothetical protein